MNSPKNDTPELTPEERNFIQRVAEHYSPPAMTPSERVAFDEALQSRLSRRKAWILKPLAVAAAAAVFGVWFVLHNAIEPDLKGQKAAVNQVLAETEGEVLLTLAFNGPNGLDLEEGLPDDYAAISSFLTDQE